MGLSDPFLHAANAPKVLLSAWAIAVRPAEPTECGINPDASYLFLSYLLDFKMEQTLPPVPSMLGL